MLPVKTDLPQSQSRLCPGSRRSFFCRMKCKASACAVKEEADTTTGCHRRRRSQSSVDRKFCVIHCTGYLKSWAPTKLNLCQQQQQAPPSQEEVESDGCNLSCLVSVGRVHQNLVQPPGPASSTSTQLNLRPMEFVSRHTMDGKFFFADQRATLFLGYLPQELLGTSCYEYYHQDDIMQLAELHRQVLQTNGSLTSHVYRFRTKEGSFVYLQTKWKNFRNPWTKEIEQLIAVNTLMPVAEVGVVESSNTPLEDVISSNSNSLDAVLSSLPGSGGGVGGPGPGGGNAGSLTSHTNSGTNSSTRFGSRVRASKIGQLVVSDAVDVLKDGDSSDSHNLTVMDTCLSSGLGPGGSPMEDGSHVYSSSLDGDLSSGGLTLNGHTPFQGSPHSNNSESYSGSNLMDTFMERELIQASYNNNNESNDEAAMAVIMSLLEADAGLGGPVDFSGLPWPLP